MFDHYFHDFSSLPLAVHDIAGDLFAPLSIAVVQLFGVGVTCRTTPRPAKAIAENFQAADGAANPGALHALVRPVLR